MLRFFYGLGLFSFSLPNFILIFLKCLNLFLKATQKFPDVNLVMDVLAYCKQLCWKLTVLFTCRLKMLFEYLCQTNFKSALTGLNFLNLE